jgi:small GTP-binding protein
MNNPTTKKYKVLIIGDANVGKTSLLLRHVDGKFNEEIAGTIGIDYRSNTYIRDNQRYDLQIWDTAGQERFKNVTKAYYRDADAALLVFDLTCTHSFENIPKWYKMLQEESGRSPHQFVTILVGNKNDCISKVKLVDIQKMVSELKISCYIQTSAKVGERVDEVFEQLLEKLITRSTGGRQPDPNIVTLNGYTPHTRSKCC